MIRLFITFALLGAAFCMTAQQVPHSTYGQIVLVNRLYETNIKMIRPDKPITVRMADGRKIDGAFYLEDEWIMVIGHERIRMDSIYSLSGFIIRNNKEKAAGAGLSILSILGTIYPLYQIIGGFGLGDGKAVFVGVTLLFFDMILAYAGTNLAGILPRRFNMMNWMIRIDHNQVSLPTSIEIPHITDP
jgi:hypothetical protein